MLLEIEQIECNELRVAMSVPGDIFHIILGRQPENVPIDSMIELCIISGKHISKIYDSVLVR